MKTFTGIPASAGIAIGKAFVYADEENPEIPRYSITAAETPAECRRLETAVAAAEGEVRALHERASREMSKEQADIFQAHLLMLEDEEFKDQLKDRLRSNLQNIEWVVWDVSREFSQKLMLSPDPVFRERAVDIADVARRVIACLLQAGRKGLPLAEITEDVILVARDLMPSDVLSIDKSRVKGIAMDEGSRTSHTAILARAFDIPAVLGLSIASQKIKNGDNLVLNGASGELIVGPDKQTLEQFEKEDRRQRNAQNQLASLRELPAQTLDGHRVALKANIEIPEEASQTLRYGAEGIGLYRSEFLYIAPGKTLDEETQFQAYSQVLKAMGKLPVTIRTVDVGGDKVLPEMQVASEKNPLLGCRAIRLSLANPEMFKMQLRAILRASINGTARIMFPMISGIEELEQALALLDDARAECAKKGQPIAKDIETGAMIEVPSAAMTADILAEKSGFFSIGTNDLVQYSMAVDRGNEKVNYLGDPCHPAVLRLLKRTIDAAHEKGIKAAMCGEFAGDTRATALLLGLELDEFSMTASSIPQVKQVIRGSTLASCKALAKDCLQKRTATEVWLAVDAWMSSNAPAEQA